MRKSSSDHRRSRLKFVAGSGEHRIDTVAVAILEMVATHPMIADHGLFGGTTAPLEADGLRNTPDLAADPDLEPVGMVVAAIALVAMDATDRDTCELFKIDDEPRGQPSALRRKIQPTT
jgi:hypothetical protein